MRAWRRWDQIADLFDGPVDADGAGDRDQVDQEIGDPWDLR